MVCGGTICRRMGERVIKQKGFTIVELLIVIVVIGILAAITIVAYNGVQQRARDTQRKNDVAAIVKALQVYKIDHDSYVEAGSGCGSGGNGNGWFGHVYGATANSIVSCLVDGGALSKEIVDPTGTTRCAASGVCRAYMKYTCGSGTYVYASLESEPAGAANTTALDGTCAPSWDEQYGMNYSVRVSE